MSANLNTLKNVPLDALMVREGFNTRPDIDPEYLRTLAEDIKAHGLMTPIQVEPAEDKDKFYIVAGHGRVMAAKFANENLGGDIKTLQAIVKRELTEDTRDAILMSDRLARQLEPIAFAKAFQRYMERNGVSQTEAAEKFHVTVAYAGDLKLLANAPAPIQEAVEQRVISSTEAVRTLKEYGEEGASVIVEALTQEVAQEAPEAPAEGATEGLPAAWGGTTQPDADAPTPAITRAKRTRKDVDRVATTNNVAPKRPRKIVPENTTDTPQDTATLPERVERAALMIDGLIANFQVENDAGIRRYASELAHWLRDYQRAGYKVIDPMSSINAETPDEDMDFILEPKKAEGQVAAA